jgi:GMP reductase
MLGGMLAGHDEGGGDIITRLFNPKNEYWFRNKTEEYNPVIQEKKYVQFYGMSSKAANEKHFGGLKDYRSSEGREVEVEYKGKVDYTIQDILGGLRSACTYVGAINLKQLSKCTTFVRCYDTHNRVYE